MLAEQLVGDDACPVCGSLSHPAPAVHGSDRVTDVQLQQAEDAYESAVLASQASGKKVSALGERLHQEHEQAGGEAVSGLTVQVQRATDEVERLTGIAQEVHRVKQEHSTAGERLKTCLTTLDGRQEGRAPLVSDATIARTELETATAAVDQACGVHASVAARLEDVGSQLRVTKCLQQARIAVEAASTQLSTAAAELDRVLAEHAFDDPAAVRSVRVPAEEQRVLRARVERYAADLGATETLLAADDLQDLPADQVDVAGPASALAKAGTDHTAAVARRSSAQQKASTLSRLAERIAGRLAAATEVRERYEVVNRLAATIKGQPPNTRQMSLESFVLAAELEEIVRAANGRLRVMTSGRYEFLHSDALAKRRGQSGLSLEVLDANTGHARQPQSLSGGEKFQASLALALGLAEVVSSRNGGIKLDTLFVDEGFGSLSDDTLETTMATLDGLREGGRIVGLISHVQSMKETIPSQLQVTVTAGGWSTIER